jgi:hypothetical protein
VQCKRHKGVLAHYLTYCRCFHEHNLIKRSVRSRMSDRPGSGVPGGCALPSERIPCRGLLCTMALCQRAIGVNIP